MPSLVSLGARSDHSNMDLPEAKCDPPIWLEFAAVARTPLAEFRVLPLRGLLLEGELHVGANLGWRALAAGAPNDPRSGRNYGLERGLGVSRRRSGVEMVQDRRNAVMQRVEAAGERSDPDIVGCQLALDCPMGGDDQSECAASRPEPPRSPGVLDQVLREKPAVQALVSAILGHGRGRSATYSHWFPRRTVIQRCLLSKASAYA